MKLFCKTCGAEKGQPHNLATHEAMNCPNELFQPLTLEAAVAWCEENGLDVERVQVSYRKPQNKRYRVALWWIRKHPMTPLSFEATAPTFRQALIAAVKQAQEAE